MPVEELRAAFDILERRYGYTLVESEQPDPNTTHLRYEAEGRAVDVWHNARAEFDVYLSGEKHDRLDLPTLLAFVRAPEASPSVGLYASARESSGQAGIRLAQLLATRGARWLRGDRDAYDALAEYRRVAMGLVTQQATKDARPPRQWTPVDRAWRTQNFPLLAKLLARLPKPHTPWEQAALDYARRRSKEH